MKKILFSVLASLSFSLPVFAQSRHYSTANAHSHNDYEHALPFYDAYARHFGSIEADVWAIKGKLYVAHSKNEIKPERTFKKLYLDPLIRRMEINGGQPYKNGSPLQLLIDLKSPYYKVMPLLKKDIEQYKKYFDFGRDTHAVRIVLSGNMPPPDSLHFFDPVFTFDGRLGNHYSRENLRRVTLVSANIQNLVSWKTNEELSTDKQQIIKRVVDSIHRQKKLIRFWATPNTDMAYKMLMKLGVDYIGTDDLPRLECLLREKDKNKLP